MTLALEASAAEAATLGRETTAPAASQEATNSKGPESETVDEPPDAISAQTDPTERKASRINPEASVEAFRVQLIALKSEAAAKMEMVRLQEAYSELLGDKDLSVERLDLSKGRGIMFGVRLGQFPNWAAAAGMCSKLKVNKQDCFVVPRY